MQHLYNLKSPLFKIIIAFTALFWASTCWIRMPFQASALGFSYMSYAATAWVLILMALIPWYSLKFKGLGIEDHFQKIMMPVLYILCLHTVFLFDHSQSIVINLTLAGVQLMFILINLILLSMHFKDKDQTPPSYFGADLYLKDLP